MIYISPYKFRFIEFHFKLIIPIVVLLFSSAAFAAIYCPHPDQISYQEDAWKLPEGWHVKATPGTGDVSKFYYSAWIAEGPLQLFSPEGVRGFVTCNYHLNHGKKGYLNIIHEERHGMPSSRNWGVYYFHIKVPHINYYCFSDNVKDCEV